MPSHGGSGQANILANDVPKLKQYQKGLNVRLHLYEVDSYLKQLKMSDSKLKCDILLNSLEEECRFEMFSQDTLGNSKSKAKVKPKIK